MNVQALEAIDDLRQAVDTLIIIPNDKLLESKRLCLPRSIHSGIDCFTTSLPWLSVKACRFSLSRTQMIL